MIINPKDGLPFFDEKDTLMSVGDKARLQEAMHADEQARKPATAGFKKARMRRVEIMRNPADGSFAIACEGARYACPLPAGYDPLKMETALWDGMVMVRQDGMAPLKCDPANGTTLVVN